MKQSDVKDQSMRVFAALPIPESITEVLIRWTHTHKEKLPFRKWTNPKDYHITLQFLGEVSVAKIEALQAALMKVKAAPIALSVNGAGTFGTPKAPRVLWSAVSGNLEGLTSLHMAIIQVTRSLGFVPEDRPFTSHITLARGFAGGNAFPIEAIDSAPSGTKWEADCFVLMRTNMNASPMYEVIGKYPLS